MVTASLVLLHYSYFVCVEIIMVKATVVIGQSFCVVCGVYCFYSNTLYSAILLCFLWRFLGLQQQ